MDPISVLVMVLVGAGCGVLETRHLAGGGLTPRASLVVGAVGALGGGLFFHVWGELLPGIMGSVASGAIGAAFVLPPVNWVVNRRKT